MVHGGGGVRVQTGNGGIAGNGVEELQKVAGMGEVVCRRGRGSAGGCMHGGSAEGCWGDAGTEGEGSAEGVKEGVVRMWCNKEGVLTGQRLEEEGSPEGEKARGKEEC